jgi:chemotaxis-related protein WspB
MLAVVLQIDQARYGMACKNVVEVIPRVVFRAIPRAPVWLSGVFVYHGNLTPVIDLCQFMAGYSCPERLSSRIVLVRCAPPERSPMLVGFLAERVTETYRLRTEVQPAPTHGGPLGAMILEDGELLQMIDENAILGGAGSEFTNQFAGALVSGHEADREHPQP